MAEINLSIQEFKNALSAHVALAASTEVGTVYRAWDEEGSNIYFVDVDQNIEDRVRAWGKGGSYDGPVLLAIYYASVGIAANGDEVEDDQERIEVEAGDQEDEPDCEDEKKHDWQQPEFLGGCRENPGVFSNNHGGINTNEVCANCGKYKRFREGSLPGQYPREPDMTTYEDADDRSQKWAEIGEYAPDENAEV